MNTPLPSSPGAIIGYRKNRTPIRLIAGGSEPAPEAPASEPPAPSPEPQAPAAPVPQGEPPQAAAAGQEPAAAQPPAPEAGNVEQLPSWAQKLIRDTRTEAASNRAKAKEQADALAALQARSQEQLDGIAKALGLKPEEATPEQIMAERDAERARATAEAGRAREAAVELAVFRAASAAEVNGNALLDSRSFVATLAGLNPAADDFAERVKTAIDAAVEANPGWKNAPPLAPVPAPPQAPAPARSGGEHTTPGGNRQWTIEDVKAAAARNPAEVAKAIDDGLLIDLGYQPSRRRR